MGPVLRSSAVRRWWRGLAVVGLVSGAFVAVAQPAAASQFTVTTAADSGVGSLRQAVLDANANAGADDVVFDPNVDTQTITLTSGALSVTDDLTVTGDGATNTIIDGNGTDRIFLITGSPTFTITGATLQNGVASSGGGGAIDSDGAVTIDATVVTDNSAPGDGGGIAADEVTVQNGSVVRANQAATEGGGVFALSGDVIVTDSAIGGASPSDGNTAVSAGGGVRAFDGSATATITNATVSHNTSGGTGGGVGAATVVVAGSTVSNNSAGDVGGGLAGEGVTVSASTISSNTASGSNGGGGLIGSNGTGGVTITDSTVSLNSANVGGGARGNGPVTITGSLFDQNTASFAGGGFLSIGGATQTTSISDSTFSGNLQTTANGIGGGAILTIDVDTTLSNLTITGNSSANDPDNGGGGGGILVFTFGSSPSSNTVRVESSTIDANSAASGAGIRVVANAAATSVGSTILSNNTGGTACDGTITDNGFNLLFNTTAGSCVFDAANDVTGADPELSALTLNAPATLVPTMALSATSPALDVVTTGCPPPATDARGVTRPQGDACDIGAFELAVTPPPPTTTTTTGAVAPATGESAGSGENGTLPFTGGPGPGLAVLGVTLLALGALLEYGPRARRRAHARENR
jgi:predicted outer membrane repeat protein